MRPDLGRPYVLPKELPTKQFFNKDNSYNVYVKDQTVEVYQLSRYNNPVQRLVINTDNYLNFEQMLINNGFTLNENQATNL